MLYINIFVFSIGLVIVKSIAADPATEITFNIQYQKSQDAAWLTCDHNDLNNLKSYTVIEGGEIKINTKFNYYINHLICRDYTAGENIFAYYSIHGTKNVTSFRVEKRMGTLWNCTILTQRDISAVHPVVQYKNNNYTAAYCFMKIHVRQANPTTEITFNVVQSQKSQDAWLTCDHNDLNNLKSYTVIEGGEIKINTKFNYYINHLICRDYTGGENIFAYYSNPGRKNVATFRVEKRMGTLWNCTILTQRDISTAHPVVQYENNNYTAAYCFMKIHVRQAKPPQTILVNNMVLPAVRNLSEKLVDFTVEYQYADGEVVDVTCANFLNEETVLTMEYEMTGAMSDHNKHIQSAKVIGILTKLHSVHNNSYIICEAKEPTDYTKVMVRFVMLNKLNIVNIKINGMTLRPKLTNVQSNRYEIEYKYARNGGAINVICEVKQTDVKLLVLDGDFRHGKVRSYKKTDLIPGKKAKMSFYPNSVENKSFTCASYYIRESRAEIVNIRFTESSLGFNENIEGDTDSLSHNTYSDSQDYYDDDDYDEDAYDDDDDSNNKANDEQNK